MKTYKVSVVFSNPKTKQELVRGTADVTGDISPEEAAKHLALDLAGKFPIIRGRSLHWDWRTEEI